MKTIIALMMALSVNAFAAQTSIMHVSLEDAWDLVSARFLSPSVIPERPTLINGMVPDMKDFPAIIWIGNCTATVVGSRVVKTAAHCTENGKISFSLGASKYSGACRQAKEYDGNSTADYSYCFTDKPVLGIEYDTINFDPDYLKVGDKVMLGGFGCTRPGGGGGIDGQYRIGLAQITRLPSGNNNDIVTTNGAALCFGDSGGAAFGLQENGDRGKLISVNSRGDINKTSYLSATHTATFARFTKDWSALYPEARICGYHQDAANCRGAAPQEPVTFKVESDTSEGVVTVNPGKIDAEKLKTDYIRNGFTISEVK